MSLRSEIEKLVKNDSTLTNKQLYKQCPEGHHTSIRVYAAEFRKLYNKNITNVILPGKNKKSKSSLSQDVSPQGKGARTPLPHNGRVNETLIEAAILDLYNKGHNNPNLVRCMVDYITKIKGKQEEIDEELDLMLFKEFGISIKDSD